MNAVVVLGAERQAASSLALAYPERRFVFHTRQDVVDGWDLPNVEIRAGRPGNVAWPEGATVVPLCPAWLNAPEREAWKLSASFDRLTQAGFRHHLPVRPAPGPDGDWQAKGDVFHRPDDPQWGPAATLADSEAPPGCGLVFQPRLAARRHFLALGRRRVDDIVFGVLRVYAERFFRDDVIQAAETVDHPLLAELTVAALRLLGREGFFSCNWLETDDGPFLTALRPVPRAGFGALRACGASLFTPGPGTTVARPGGAFIAYPHYAAYRRPLP